MLPDLAASWDVSADGTVYTFNLRNDVFWSDGTRVTAADVEYGILRSLDPATGAAFAFLVADFIVNGAAFNAGEAEAADVTLRIELTQPAGYFPTLASLTVMFPQPQGAIEEHGARWTEPDNIISNGPYDLLSWSHGTSIVLRKNAAYYDAGSVAIETVDYKMVEEPSTALAMYEAGALDTTILPIEEMDRVL